LAIWLLGGIFLGTIVAKAAFDAQSYIAPLVIFPLLVGLVLGGLLLGLMRIGHVGHRHTIIYGTILAALIAIVGQHFFSYLSARNFQYDQSELVEKARPALPESVADRLPAPPANFFQYMRQQAHQGRILLFDYNARAWIAWLSWIIDGLLVMAGSLAVVVPAMFLPFCSRCHTWYGTIRSAHLPASAVKHIAALIGQEPGDRLRSGRCRLICCRCGWGSTGCELSWEDTTGAVFSSRVWLDTAARNQIMQVLDQVTSLEELP